MKAKIMQLELHRNESCGIDLNVVGEVINVHTYI